MTLVDPAFFGPAACHPFLLGEAPAEQRGQLRARVTLLRSCEFRKVRVALAACPNKTVRPARGTIRVETHIPQQLELAESFWIFYLVCIGKPYETVRE